jgi:hypothetical protein
VRLYKRLDELGAVLYLGLQRNGKVSVEMLLEFIDQRMREAGKTMDSRAREMVFQRSACDLRSLSHELDKLCSYSGSRSQVRAQDVENVMTDYGEGWVFDLFNRARTTPIETLGRASQRSASAIGRTPVARQRAAWTLEVGYVLSTVSATGVAV